MGGGRQRSDIKDWRGSPRGALISWGIEPSEETRAALGVLMSPVKESGLILRGLDIPEGFVSRKEVVPKRWEGEDGRLVRRLLQ